MSGWGVVTWNIARAGGFTAYGLLALAVLVGLALSLQWQAPHWPRLINSELHNFLTLLSLVFICIHVLAVWVDPFTNFGLGEIVVPFISHYRPLWMALGLLALYLGLAIALSTWLRPRIGYRWWRRLHTLTLLAFALTTLHGLGTGSDTRTIWGIAIYVASVALVSAALWFRLLLPVNARGRAHPVLAALLCLLLIGGFTWAELGPLQSGWSAQAGGTQSTPNATPTPTTDNQGGQLSPP